MLGEGGFWGRRVVVVNEEGFDMLDQGIVFWNLHTYNNTLCSNN